MLQWWMGSDLEYGVPDRIFFCVVKYSIDMSASTAMFLATLCYSLLLLSVQAVRQFEKETIGLEKPSVAKSKKPFTSPKGIFIQASCIEF